MRTVDLQSGAVQLIDQTALPDSLRIVECRSHVDIIDAIQTMKVRGAPAIGVTAAFGTSLEVEVEVFPLDDARGRDSQLERAVEILLEKLERNPPPPVPSLETVNRSRKNPSR